MKVLSFTTLYPNAAMPQHGVFVENRLKRLAARPGIDLKVMAPVPYFFDRSSAFGTHLSGKPLPREETRFGIPISHPRYPLIPKIGMGIAPRLLERWCRPALRKWISAHGRPDVLDAHYMYPDGVAAARLGQAFDIPVVITARGSDLNLIPQHAGPREQIRWAAQQAAALITVCDALQQPLLEMGITPQKITTLRNGVDLELFCPGGREEAAALWGGDGLRLLSVGGLIERKGNHLIIEALAQTPGARLLIAGSGPERKPLEALSEQQGVADRVRFAGQIAHEDLPALYTAADALVLASSREGWANVLLEAMACGTPVIATAIWGTPEVVKAPEAGVLVERTADSIAEGIKHLSEAPPDRAATRAYAEQFSWDATIDGLEDLLRQAAQR